MARSSKSSSRAQAKEYERWERERRGDVPKGGGGPSAATVLVFNTTVGEVQRRLGGYCPGHEKPGDSNPSLGIVSSSRVTGAVACTCFSGRCSREQLRAALAARGFNTKSQGRTPSADTGSKNDQEAATWRQRRKAFVRVFAAQHRGGRTANIADYLQGRGITVEPEFAWARGDDEIVFPVLGDKGLHAAHTLTVKRLRGKVVKIGKPITEGPLEGGYIPLGKQIEPGAPCIVGEGLESVLSAMQLAGIGAGAATCGTGGMPGVRLPPSGQVIIAADNDDAGIKAASALANRLEVEGRKVVIARPQYQGEA